MAQTQPFHRGNNESQQNGLEDVGRCQPAIEDPEQSAPRPKEYTSDQSQSHDEALLDDKPKHLSWKQRIKHVTWAWFTLTMATGGISNVLGQVPYRFNGLHALGTIFFIMTLVFYIIIWAMMIARFYWYPPTFFASLVHPTESLFVPAFAVSWGTLLINMTALGADYTGEWFTRVLLVLYWTNAAFAFILSVAVYLTLWSSQSFTIARMTPIWIFPVYPLLIIGPNASALSGKLTDPGEAIRVIVGGCTMQGIGFLVSLTIYAAFVYRLFTQKIPAEPLRPGMFVSVGPSAFTVSGMLGSVMNLPSIIAATPDATFLGVPGTLAAQILRVSVSWMSLWVWGLAWWFFFISLLTNVDCLRKKHRVPFAMPWFSFIFPQTALTTATFSVAKSFDVEAIKIIGCVMACLLIVVWIFVVGSMFNAILCKQLLWPGKGEDRAEGGFKSNEEERSAPADRDDGHAVRRGKRNTREHDPEA